MLELLRHGGPVMWFLAGCAILATSIFLERLFHLHRAQIKTTDFLKGVYTIVQRGNIAEAVSICEDTPGPVSHIARVAILHHDAPNEEIRQAIENAGLVEIPRLEKNMSMLATIAKISTLAGLLGTVIGMFKIFLAMQATMPLVRFSDVAGGMTEALLTTITGLVIAIPTYAGYNFLITRIESVMLDMERSSNDLLAFFSSQFKKNPEVL